MAGNKTKTRRFSYTNPIMFHGSYYPTAEWDIQSDTGEVNPTTVFADANGSYYTLDNNGSAIPVMPFHNLDEVTVTAPKGIAPAASPHAARLGCSFSHKACSLAPFCAFSFK